VDYSLREQLKNFANRNVEDPKILRSSEQEEEEEQRRRRRSRQEEEEQEQGWLIPTFACSRA